MTQTRTIWTDSARRLDAPTALGAMPVVVAEPEGRPDGTVLLVHGRNGAPGQPQIAEIADAYLARGWRVAAPELPNSAALPMSGPPEQVTFAGHTDAAAGVWAWVAQQWPDAPRGLAGHSLGGFAIAHLASASPDTHHVLAVSPPMSGRVLLRARGDGAICDRGRPARVTALFRRDADGGCRTRAEQRDSAPCGRDRRGGRADPLARCPRLFRGSGERALLCRPAERASLPGGRGMRPHVRRRAFGAWGRGWMHLIRAGSRRSGWPRPAPCAMPVPPPI